MHHARASSRGPLGTRAGVSRLRAALAVLAVAVCTAVAAPVAHGQAQVALGENHSEVFADPNFQALGIHQVRAVVPWDAVLHPGWERDDVDRYVAAADAAGVEVMVAFNHSRTTPAQAPNVWAYWYALRAFHDRYPSVRTVTPWNEPNHPSQPTWTRPALAAQYYNVARRVYADGVVVAGDVLDLSTVLDWLAAYRAKLATAPAVWGVHGYGDANRARPFDTSVLKRILDAVPDGEFWLTETGGIVRFLPAFPFDLDRAARSITHAFELADASPRITRIYLYNWYGSAPDARWDTGLVDADGTPRPGLDAVRARLGLPPLRPPAAP
jgi:hypothetical protein